MYDGGPAFPCGPVGGFGPAEGMSLRDYFAGQALAFWANAKISGWTGDMTPEYADNVTRHAYIIADAMLRARKGGES